MAALLLLKRVIGYGPWTSSTCHRLRTCERYSGTFEVRLRESIGFNTLTLAPQNGERCYYFRKGKNIWDFRKKYDLSLVQDKHLQLTLASFQQSTKILIQMLGKPRLGAGNDFSV